MKKQIENAMRNSSPDFETRYIDFQMGDIVQLWSHKTHSGRIGKITGVAFNPRKQYISYTVQFSDNEAISVSAYSIRLVRKHDLPEHEPVTVGEAVTESE